MTSTTSNPPESDLTREEIATANIEELLDRHLEWAWKWRNREKVALNQRSQAIKDNLGLRLELMKIRKGTGSGNVIDIKAFLSELGDDDKRDEPPAGVAIPQAVDGGDAVPA